MSKSELESDTHFRIRPYDDAMKQQFYVDPLTQSKPRLSPVNAAACLALTLTLGCSGPQSALQPVGVEAEQIASLFWWMLGGGTLVWLVMIGLAIYSVRTSVEGPAIRQTRLLIIGGGTVVPTIVLTVLLLYSLPMLPQLLARPPEGSLKVEVHGRMWWWRVRYPGSTKGESVELANEIRLPVGSPVEFRLSSDDVIHAFWIPSLGGKVDMFPGRSTRLTLNPTKTGLYRGACAEYCGSSHALMNFDVIVMERDEFESWLDAQRTAARESDSATAARGQKLFLRSGCHACHTIRGIVEQSSIAPDLTHFGSRHTVGAGILPNRTDQVARWISHADQIKPDVRMPAFRMLPDDDVDAIATFLKELK